MATLAIIGGTGLTRIDGLTITRREMVKTPYGAPSCPLVFGEFNGKPVAFLARHGSTHRIPPHRINYCANLWALHSVGIERVIAVGAVGGIDLSCKTGSVVVPHQIIDYTHGREHTFFNGEPDPVRQVDFSHPYDESLRRALIEGGQAASAASDSDDAFTLIEDGVYGAMQGPRLETAAEIERLARDGCTVVGMTGMPEAALARELELSYACCAVVVNPAAGTRPGPVDVEAIGEAVVVGMRRARRVLAETMNLLQ